MLPLRLNAQLVRSEALDEASGERLRGLLERHVEATGSPRAAELLASWPDAVAEFRHVRPKADIRRLEAEAEGTEHAEQAEPRRGEAAVAPR